MANVTMKQLLEAGVHFGHQTRRWNPKMEPYLFGERNGIHIVDLRQTLEQLGDAYEYIKDLTARGGIVLFVGTKKQAQLSLSEQAARAGMPYVTNRWLGGMLTNWHTTHKRILYMRELERMNTSGEMEALPKKERIRLRRELEKLHNNLGGVGDLHRVPDAIFIIDVVLEHIAVREAERLDIPIIAIVDTNCDPDPISFVIPGNDDAIRAAELFASAIADACIEGRKAFESRQQAGREGADEAPAAEADAAPEPAASPEVDTSTGDAAAPGSGGSTDVTLASGDTTEAESAAAEPAGTTQPSPEPSPDAAVEAAEPAKEAT